MNLGRFNSRKCKFSAHKIYISSIIVIFEFHNVNAVSDVSPFYFYRSSDLDGTLIADVRKSSTFAFELI